MKRFYKNTLISRVCNQTLRVVALLCVLLGVSSTAWAETGFYQSSNYYNAALSVKFNKGDWHNYKIYGEGETALGNLTKKLELEEFYYRTYNTDGDNVCSDGSQIEFYIDGAETPQTAPVQWSRNYEQDGNKHPQEWKYTTINVDFPTTVGKHEIYVKVKAKVGNDCSGTICLTNQDGGKCDGGGYYITYNVPAKIYVYGDAIEDDYSPCELTETDNVVRYKLDKLAWFKYSNRNSENLDGFYKTNGTYKFANQADAWAHKGAHINKHDNKGGNSLEEVQIDKENGYSEPVYFYYDLSSNKYWVEATQKIAYTLKFEDGKEYSCTDLESGENCIQTLELEEGTYKFKVYRNGNPYYRSTAINNSLSQTSLTAGDQWTTLNISKYGTCTFTISDNVKLKIDYEEQPEPVLLSYNPIISADNKSATLSAYLQGTLCATGGITEYGFVFCSGGNGCIPTTTSLRKAVTPSPQKGRGDEFTYTATTENDEFMGSVTYGYRAYVIIDGEMYLSRETNYFRLEDDCVPQPAGQGVVTFTIDASLGADYENDCKLIYGSLQTAINKLRDSYKNDDPLDEYVLRVEDGEHNSYNLQQPVIFNVKNYNNGTQSYCYEGNKTAGISGGGDASEKSLALIFKEFNSNNDNKNNTLTIKGISDNAEINNRPKVHHIILRNSRNIVLENLLIISDPSGEREDDALEFDLDRGDFWDVNVGDRDHNILVKDCMIGSNGFTGLHASGYDGVTFENNEFEAVMKKTGNDDNTIKWGASAKFMMCKNIKFIRNNFRGEHATLVWLQECENVLFMNNVFWNTNQYDYSGCTAIRLVAQYNRNIDKHGFYYNTFFLADNVNNEKYNFMKFDLSPNNGGGSASNYIKDGIEFMYNNCYSYDTDVPGRNSEPFLEINLGEKFPKICNNNFWSLYDQKQWIAADSPAGYNSVFEFGCNSDFTNVSELVCKTTATGPASLVIKGGGDLNKGVLLTVDGIKTATNQIVDPKEVKYDRYNANVRPGANLTYGAYQGKEASTLQADSETGVPTIYWVGVSEKWDDRNNWAYFTTNEASLASEEPQARALRQTQRLSCVNDLPVNLKAVITEDQVVVLKEGERKWPQLPSSFDSGVRESESGIPAEEQVSAGVGIKVNGQQIPVTKFADNIELKYGAAIKGIEKLVNGEVNDKVHYGSATTNFIAPRDGWVLVGTIVKPFKNGTSGDTRNIVSGDYFLNHLPKVKMHQIETKTGNQASDFTWANSFKELYIEVPPYSVFAIQIPDQYGQYGLTAANYYKKYGVKYDPTEPIVYKPFVGRFVNESGNHPIEYEDLESGKYNLLNNSYPCNIDAKKLVDLAGGELQYYDGGSFKPLTGVDGEVLLKPQHGFIFKPTNGRTLTITKEMLADGNTRSRSAEVEMPTFSLNVVNANTKIHNSNVAIRYDEFLGEGNISENNVEKAFASTVKESPELYIVANDDKYSSIDIATESKVIPLGLRIKQPMNVRFEKAWFRGFSQATLVDKVTGEEYDLMTETYTTKRLEVGDIEGRFFLNLEEGVIEDELPEEGGDVSTELEDNTAIDSVINIIVEESDNSIRVVTNGVELKTIYVSDMAGRTMKYDVSGCAVSLKLPVPQGVYLMHVIGDTASRTEKVILK